MSQAKGDVVRTLLITAIIASCPATALPQSITAAGVGLHTCGEAMQKMEHYGITGEGFYIDWVQGYITGRNAERFSSAPRKNALVSYGVSADTITASIKNKCRQDALKLIISVAEDIYKELEARPR